MSEDPVRVKCSIMSSFWRKYILYYNLFLSTYLWIWIFLSMHDNVLRSEGLQEIHMNALNLFSLKWMTLTLRGGLWTFWANLALCGLPASDMPVFPNVPPGLLLSRSLGRYFRCDQDIFQSFPCVSRYAISYGPYISRAFYVFREKNSIYSWKATKFEKKSSTFFWRY